MDVDEALESLGKYGRWQLWHYTLFASAMMFPHCFQVLGILFSGAVPPHHCRVQDNSSLIYVEKDGELVLDGCNMLNLTAGDGNVTIPCDDGWVYDESFGKTIVSEWDLVCNYNYLSEMTQTVYGFGMLAGTLTVPPVADRFGRKTAFLVTQFMLVVVTLISAFAPNYTVFSVCRFFQGFIGTGVLSVGMVAACELFPAKRRTFAGVFVEFFWSASLFALCFLGYMIRQWRYLQVAFALLSSLTLSGFWLCPESIPWLVANRRTEQAERILQKAAKMNKLNPPNVILREAHEQEQGEERSKGFCRKEMCDCEGWKDEYLKLCSHRMLRKNTVILFLLWFVNSLVYFGLSFTSVILTPNRFLNFFFNALVEIPGAILCYYFLHKVGRRLPLCVFHTLAGVFLVALVFVPHRTAGGYDMVWLIVTLNMIGKLFITASFDTIFMYTPELFPTNLRNTGFGISAFARCGGMIAPYSTLVIRIISWLPGVVFGALSVGAGLLALCLPETRHHPLPQTAEEMDTWEEEACFSFTRPGRKRGKDRDVYLEDTGYPKERDNSEEKRL